MNAETKRAVRWARKEAKGVNIMNHEIKPEATYLRRLALIAEKADTFVKAHKYDASLVGAAVFMALDEALNGGKDERAAEAR